MNRKRFGSLIAPNDLSARVLGVMLLILGMMMVAAGVWIMLLSGYAYHLYCGVGALVSGALLIRYRRVGTLALFVFLTFSVFSVLIAFQQGFVVLATSLIIPNGFMLGLIIITPYLTKRHFGRGDGLANQKNILKRLK